MKTIIFLNNDHLVLNQRKTIDIIKINVDLKHDYIIAVDGGLNILNALNIEPDLHIGDLDSYSKNSSHNNIKTIKYPCDKDYSDFELSLEYLPKGTSEIIIFGLIGGRLDHSLMNLFVTCHSIKHPCRIFCYPQENKRTEVESFQSLLFLPSPAHISINGVQNSLLSLLSFDNHNEATVSSLNLRYPLKKTTIPYGSSLGLSNYCKQDQVDIELHSGKLLISLYYRSHYQILQQSMH